MRVLIVAGEPGGSIPATRARIEQSWGARVIDHHGLTEVGPISFECWEAPGFLHVNEAEYICEVLDPVRPARLPDGEPGELVVTNLGRTASPVIRYRTGDIVVRRSERVRVRPHLGAARRRHPVRARTTWSTSAASTSIRPHRSGRAAVSRRSWSSDRPCRRHGAMRSLTLEIELAPHAGRRPRRRRAGVAASCARRSGLTVPVHVVEAGTLPRFEMKARRFVVEA